MVRNQNKMEILGQLGDDPEKRTTQNGRVVVGMRVATNIRFRNQEGEQKKGDDDE